MPLSKPRKSGKASRWMCRAWLCSHSPQYISRRIRITQGDACIPKACSRACTAVIWYATGQMPQIRATTSSTSWESRPSRNFSK
jgi:hypothetical protein